MSEVLFNSSKVNSGEIRDVPEDVEIIAGQGLKFSLAGELYYIGNRKLFEISGINVDEQEDYLRNEENKG